MFKKNDGHSQLDIFSISNNLTEKKRKLWYSSKEHSFYNQVFIKIQEKPFKVLYSSKKSRPNVPVNQLVGALIIKHLKNWTYEELFTNLNFNMLTRHAIGIKNFEVEVFCEASLYNFQNKVVRHLNNTGEDLIEKVYQQLTQQQLKDFNVDTSIQRGDSFLVGSNVVRYSRLGLLIEVLQRLMRVLTKEDQELLNEELEPYMKTRNNYIYHLEKENVDGEIEKIARVYNTVIQALGRKYNSYGEYQNLLRVFKDQFTVKNKEVKVIPSKKLVGGILKSPDDIEATYRSKGKQNSVGYKTHISETANPENDINLITDVHTCQNRIGDAEILENRLPIMLEQTPRILRYFVDGQYGGPKVDLITTKHKIDLFQRISRGKTSTAGLKIRKKKKEVWVSCKGGQDIEATESKANPGRWSVSFNEEGCELCPFKYSCAIPWQGGKKTVRRKAYYFNEEKIKIHERLANFSKLKGKERHTRANVEASVKEAQRGMRNKKVRVRGRIRVSLHMIFTVIAINLTRIHKNKGQTVYFMSHNYCRRSERIKIKSIG